MPSIQRLYDKLKSEDFVVVAVNVQDSQDTARKFIEDNHLTLPVILDKELIATRMYGIRGFPTTFLIDKDGTMRAMYVGSREWDAENVLAVMRSLLNK
jgi:peroxiredoxin